MSEERKPWEQLTDRGEPDVCYARFVVFLRMGGKRSINAACLKNAKKNQERSRTNAGPEWYETAKTWKWEERARAYDEYNRAQEDLIIAQEKEKILRSGFSLMHKRIKELDRLSRKLIQMTTDDAKIWMPETRTITTGEGRSQTIEKYTFNHQLFALIDKYFDSIAKEVGDRVKKQELDVKTADSTESLHRAIAEALEQYPEARIALAEKLTEQGGVDA